MNQKNTLPLTWDTSVMTINEFEKLLMHSSMSRVDVNPIGQRPDVESISKRQGIIDTVIRGYDFGELKLRTLVAAIREATSYKYRSIDGGHRKRAIRDFIAGKFKTSKHTVANINGREVTVGNKYYKELPQEVKDQFGNYKMRFTIYSESMTDEQAGETFRRTNITTDVNHQEMLNSYEDNLVAKFVREISRPIPELNNGYHPLFEYKSLDPENRKQVWFQKASNRLRDDEFVTRLLTMLYKLETNSYSWLTSSNREMEKLFIELGDPIKGSWVTDPSINKRHQRILTEALDFILNFAKAKKNNSKGLLSNQDFTIATRFYIYLNKTFTSKGYRIKDFNELYCSIRNAMDRFVGSDDNNLRVDVHKDDKGIRLVCECFKQYLTVHDDMKRSEQSVKWLLEEMDINRCGIIFLDPVREFSRDMIEEMWRKQGRKCWVTGLPLDIKDSAGGHIIAHSEGGRTTFNNGMACHKDHNSKMGSMNAIMYRQSILENLDFAKTIHKELA
jgi:5-methylcytosine-specific restriction endonuclease McrA